LAAVGIHLAMTGKHAICSKVARMCVLSFLGNEMEKKTPQIYLKNVEGPTRKHIFLLNNVECRCVNEKDSSKRIITYCDDDNLRRMLKVVVRKEKRKNISEKNRCDDARSCWS
jgi:hypothetical protein